MNVATVMNVAVIVASKWSHRKFIFIKRIITVLSSCTLITQKRTPWEFRWLGRVYSDHLHVISFRFWHVGIPAGRQLESALLSAVCMHETKSRPDTPILIKFHIGGFNKIMSSHVKFDLD